MCWWILKPITVLALISLSSWNILCHFVWGVEECYRDSNWIQMGHMHGAVTWNGSVSEATHWICISCLICLLTTEPWIPMTECGRAHHKLPVFYRRVPIITKSISFVMSVCLSVSPSVCPSAGKKSVPTRGNFMRFYIWVFFKNMLRK